MAGVMPNTPLPRIEHASHPKYPEFTFEWHPWTQKVYVVHVPGRRVDGVFVPDPTVGNANAVALAEHCEHHAMFLGFVQTYLRGYVKGLENRDVGTT